MKERKKEKDRPADRQAFRDGKIYWKQLPE